ncbi:MAG: glycosyltransferase family 4 protein [Bacteriovoracaceae bacterium]|nr:glycosyltransferase family 4 protein [Bacteriovoracaceae bacterium]
MTKTTKKSLNIGFISFRFSSTDGVSLETSKWAQVLEGLGHKCFYFAGECDRPEEVSYVVEQANFHHPKIKEKHHEFWSSTKRSHDDSLWIKSKTEVLYKDVKEFAEKYDIDVFIPQNIFSYPLNIPLTLAVTEYIAENSFPTIAHNHDFYWERKMFYVNSVWDYLTMAFPPTLHSIHHVVINSSARHQMAIRRGVPSTLIPNVMNFEEAAPEPDDYSKDLRQVLGIGPDDKLILQPTRVVQRKGIEHAIELVSRMQKKDPTKMVLVISHAVHDDEVGYVDRIVDYAKLMSVDLRFFPDLFDEKRGTAKDGSKIYSLWDIYPHADLITYPSIFEGFGNAFLEALHFKKPIVVNNYSIYEMDIRTKGFKVVFFDDFITESTVEESLHLIENKELADEWAEHNYALALEHYSYTYLEKRLKELLQKTHGLY